MAKAATAKAKSLKTPWKIDFRRNWPVYMISLPVLIYEIVLHYVPMFGIVMAFEDFSVAKGYFHSPWVGMQNFIDLFSSAEFPTALRNTVAIAILKCTIGFVPPIIFAFMLTSLRKKKFKRTIQTFSYLPNFVASVVVCALVIEFLSKDGPLTMLFTHLFGAENQNWLANNHIPVFWIIYIFMGIWQGLGWGSIMYVAAISTVNGDLYEAAAIDGATRWQRLTKITLPCIMPTIVMMFVLGVGTSFIGGFDNILLLYMPSTYNVADTIYTYTYRMAFTSGANYSLSAASGLFQSVVGTILLITSNTLSKKVTESSLF